MGSRHYAMPGQAVSSNAVRLLPAAFAHPAFVSETRSPNGLEPHGRAIDTNPLSSQVRLKQSARHYAGT